MYKYFKKDEPYRVAFVDASTPVLLKYGVRKEDGGATYYLDRECTVKLIFCKGKKRVPYFRTESGYREQTEAMLKYSESAEHYQAKAELMAEKSITINGIEYKAHSADMEVEFKETGNIIDVVFFDEDDNIIMGIELVESNSKSTEDKKKLQKLNINIYEKKTSNSGSTIKDKFICFESSTEAIRESISRTDESIRDIKADANDLEYRIKRYEAIREHSGYGKDKPLHRQVRKIEEQIRSLQAKGEGLGSTVEDRVQKEALDISRRIEGFRRSIESDKDRIEQLKSHSGDERKQRSLNDEIKGIESACNQLENYNQKLESRIGERGKNRERIRIGKSRIEEIKNFRYDKGEIDRLEKEIRDIEAKIRRNIRSVEVRERRGETLNEQLRMNYDDMDW